MLKLALKARLPLIAAHTDDPANVERVLRHIVGKVDPIPKFTSETQKITAGSVWYRVGGMPTGPGTKPPEKVLQWFTGAQSTLVLVNSKGEIPAGAYNAGGIPTPSALVKEQLSSAMETEDIEALMPTLGGLTLTQVFWAVSLAGAKHRELTPAAIADIRRTAFPPNQGLALVNLDLDGYVREPQLDVWLESRAPFFLTTPDERLRPRGLLLDGPPGTGKTLAAKFLALSLGVPLYRLALEEVKAKWVGESEKALAQALAQVDHADPCVLLIDEVEKLFSSQHDSGVTQNLLAGMLWWLQEHSSRVLTVMTTNDAPAIPPELTRSGRIDKAMHFPGVAKKDAPAFLKSVGGSYDCERLTSADVSGIIKTAYQSIERVPQAVLAGAVAGAMRKHLLQPRKRRSAVRVHRTRSPN